MNGERSGPPWKETLRLAFPPLGIWAFFTLVGYAAGPPGEAALHKLVQLVRAWELSGVELVLFILVNNGAKAFLALALGVGLGIFPVLFLAINGVVLGQVIAQVVARHSPALALAGLAPHGVLEIPAFLLASGLGLRLGWEAHRRLLGQPSQLRLWWRAGLRTYLRTVLPLLAIAAVVEVLLTPLVVAPFL